MRPSLLLLVNSSNTLVETSGHIQMARLRAMINYSSRDQLIKHFYNFPIFSYRQKNNIYLSRLKIYHFPESLYLANFFIGAVFVKTKYECKNELFSKCVKDCPLTDKFEGEQLV